MPMLRVRGLSIVFALLVCHRVARAQREPKLHTAQPERPSVSTHAGTVSTGWFEIETGLELDNGQDPDHTGVMTLAAKLGLGERLQLSVLTSALRATGFEGGVGDMTVGLKYRVLADHPLLGDFAIMPSIKIPTGSVRRGTGTQTSDATLLMISSRELFGADLDVVLAMRDAARERKVRHRVGVAQSKDSFYGEVEPERMPVSGDLERRWKAWVAGGAISSEMESATLFIVAATLRARAGGIMVCVGSPTMTREESEASMKGFSIDPVIDTAVHGLRLLIARDRAAGA
mgnify:CR=1 FL=1